MNKFSDSQLIPPFTQPRFDKGRHHRAKIGYLLLATEQTIEDDVMKLCPHGVGVHFTRIPIPDSITNKTLAAQAELLAHYTSTLLPDGSLDVVCYACTSGSIVIGENKVDQELSKGAPMAITTSLIRGVVRALRTINAKRIVVATPYLDEINQVEEKYLENAGFEVLSICGLNLEKDSEMVCVTPDYISEFALSIDTDKADAIFISCGALRSLDVVDKIEKIAKKPVIASNQAMIWETLRLAGINDQIQGYGTLLSNH